MRKFVVLVDDTAPTEERDAITKMLEDEPRVEWWHWFNFAWLINDPAGRSAAEWSERIRAKVSPRTGLVVLQVKPEDTSFWIEREASTGSLTLGLIVLSEQILKSPRLRFVYKK